VRPRSTWTINGIERPLRNRFVGMCKMAGCPVPMAVHALLRRENLLKVLFAEWVEEERGLQRKQCASPQPR
jgi:hypothetical protein